MRRQNKHVDHFGNDVDFLLGGSSKTQNCKNVISKMTCFFLHSWAAAAAKPLCFCELSAPPGKNEKAPRVFFCCGAVLVVADVRHGAPLAKGDQVCGLCRCVSSRAVCISVSSLLFRDAVLLWSHQAAAGKPRQSCPLSPAASAAEGFRVCLRFLVTRRRALLQSLHGTAEMRRAVGNRQPVTPPKHPIMEQRAAEDVEQTAARRWSRRQPRRWSTGRPRMWRTGCQKPWIRGPRRLQRAGPRLSWSLLFRKQKGRRSKLISVIFLILLSRGPVTSRVPFGSRHTGFKSSCRGQGSSLRTGGTWHAGVSTDGYASSPYTAAHDCVQKCPHRRWRCGWRSRWRKYGVYGESIAILQSNRHQQLYHSFVENVKSPWAASSCTTATELCHVLVTAALDGGVYNNGAITKIPPGLSLSWSQNETGRDQHTLTGGLQTPNSFSAPAAFWNALRH